MCLCWVVPHYLVLCACVHKYIKCLISVDCDDIAIVFSDMFHWQCNMESRRKQCMSACFAHHIITISQVANIIKSNSKHINEHGLRYFCCQISVWQPCTLFIFALCILLHFTKILHIKLGSRRNISKVSSCISCPNIECISDSEFTDDGDRTMRCCFSIYFIPVVNSG